MKEQALSASSFKTVWKQYNDGHYVHMISNRELHKYGVFVELKNASILFWISFTTTDTYLNGRSAPAFGHNINRVFASYGGM